MNSSAIVTRIVFIAVALLFYTCDRPRVFYFTPADMSWMPYDTASVQGTFVNESGDTFNLMLLSRKVSHYNIAETNDQGNSLEMELKLDTVFIGLKMFKERRTGQCFMDIPDLWMDLQVADFAAGEIGEWGMGGSFDSLQVGSITYPNAVELSRDTVSNPGIRCWRLYYGRDVGLIRADFRDGQYYQIQ